jgi:hypothetical protein
MIEYDNIVFLFFSKDEKMYVRSRVISGIQKKGYYFFRYLSKSG